VKISHEDADRFPATMLAMLIDAGYVEAWPLELKPHALRIVKAHGWMRAAAGAHRIVRDLPGFVCSVGNYEGVGRYGGG